MIRRAVAVLLLALGAGGLLCRTAYGAAPRRDWRTIVTPRFRVHYHEGTGELAARVSRDAEMALDVLVEILGHHPSVPIHVVVTDETDGANGFAELLPQNVVTLFAGVPPAFSTLGDYDDFMRLLVLHELVHIVHIDTILGIPRWVNAIFGKTFVPNSVQPQWVVEGIAVWLESKLTSGGRVKSSYIDLLVRTQVLAGRFPDIDRLSHFTRTFPGSSYSWFLGGRFLDFIARRHGDDAIAEMSRAYGARPIPYAINLVAERATGETFVDMYAAWHAEEVARARSVVARVTAEGLVEGEGIRRESPLVVYPRFSPGGSLAIVEQPRDDDDELVILGPDLETELVRLRTNDGRGAFTPDGAVYVATVNDVVDRVYSHDDLELIDVSTGARRRRTRGWRLSAPDVSPDGETIVAVAQEAGRTRLVTLSTFGDDDPVTLGALAPGEQVYAPRWSPDGRAIAVSLLSGSDADRHIVLVDRATGRRRRLTRGGTRNHWPCWSPDGRRIFYSSDRGGIFNVFAVEVATRREERLTNVVSGALMPAVDPQGDRLVFVHGVATGWELRELDLLAVRLPAPAEEIRAVVTPTVTAAVYPDVDYSPWEALIPKAWLPSFAVDGVGDTVGVILSGADALRAHVWSLSTWYGLESERFGYDFSYRNRQTPWPLTIDTSLSTTTRPGSFAPAVAADDRLESIFRARASLSFPLGRWDSGHDVSVSYGVETRRGTNLFDSDPFAPAPRGLGDLTLASVGAAWSFSNVRGYAESISSAQGYAFSTAVRLHAPEIGSDLRILDVTGAFTGYVTMPWLDHHVLAARLSLGGAAGDARGRQVFVLGGLPIRNVVTDAIDGIGFGIDVIRGYERAVFRGNAYYLGTVEYRMPLASLTEGWFTLPFYLDRVHAAVYADAGATVTEVVELSETKVGVGAEARLDLAVGYVQPYTLRFGYARGLAGEGIDNWYLVLGGLF